MEPETPGNIGAVCRVMKNFGLKKLILINPQCEYDSNEAIARSKHAKDVLKKAKVIKKFSDLKGDYIIGTTAIQGNDYNIPRLPLTPEDLAKKIKTQRMGIFKNQNRKFIILFGREGNGLVNEEIRKCDMIVTIPSDKKYPTLNLSHSVGIMCYEIFKTQPQDVFPLASLKDKETLFKHIDKQINQMTFTTPDKKETQHFVWRKVLNKAVLTKREIYALFGFFKKLK
ncbi:MAG: RNA methyltransferase [Nanoarchaeota archaeon]|nr:RNA methyltransferase [Nanoarchaeota archaeon]